MAPERPYRSDSGGRPARRSPQRDFDFGRTVALSDGVFAIALTILVVTIGVPHLSSARQGELPRELLAVLPQVGSYALSFAVIARLWRRHHHFFADLARVDGRLAGLNLFYLALIAFIPFPTAVLGEYGTQPIAAAVYGATIAVVAAVSGVMRGHALRAGLLAPEVARPQARRWLSIATLFAASVPLAFISPYAAEALWVASLFLRAG